MNEQSRPGLQKATRVHPAEPDQTPPSRGGEAGGASEETVTFSFRGPKSLRRRLRMHAAETDRSVQDVAVEALQEYLERHGR